MNIFVSLFLVGLFSFGGSFIVAQFRGIPSPYIHDEFSYILAGDTFAHGRVTNPPHPLLKHFETIHVLQQPTYMSKYPPGQGLFLAAGQMLFNHPIYGVWLSTAMMCMAICWMLYAWVPSRWAFIGGVVAVLQFGVFTYWSQSYWGGAVAGIGGALVVGALPRIYKYERLRDDLWLGCGVAVLAISRQFEGILIGIPLGVLVLSWKIKWDHIDKRRLLKRVVFPFSLILLITILGVGAYNKAGTGNAFLSPYVLYTKQYSSVPYFIWESLGKPLQYNNEMMASFKNIKKSEYFEKKTWEGFLKRIIRDGKLLFIFFFGFPLALVIPFLVFWRKEVIWRIILAIVVVLATCAVVVYRTKAHYFSSLTCLVVLLIIGGVRVLSLLKIQRVKIGLLAVILLFFVQFIMNVIYVRKSMSFSLGRVQEFKEARESNLSELVTREQLERILKKQGGKHLVIVQYLLQQYFYFEWVYNDADIDRSSIVWARSMGVKCDTELLTYFKDRHVWHVTVVKDNNIGPHGFR